MPLGGLCQRLAGRDRKIQPASSAGLFPAEANTLNCLGFPKNQTHYI
jgi:hypothetical protein